MRISRDWTGWCVGAALLAGMNAMAEEAGKVSTQWEELTAADFVTGIHQSQGVCLLPFGIWRSRAASAAGDGSDQRTVGSAARCGGRYAVVFPAYYFGQIDEARHERGTLAYSRHMQLDLLQETTDEMARNG